MATLAIVRPYDSDHTRVCAVYGEYTLCGVSFDASNDRDEDEWIEEINGSITKNVTCRQCKELISYIKRAK